MDIQKLQFLLNKEEGPKLDFKLVLNIETSSGKKELAKDISAIANSRGGRGYIVFGVEDKTKRIEGINPSDFVEEKIQQIISARCEPPIPLSVETILYKEKYIAIITIYSGEQKPYQIRENGAFYIRRGSTTDIMRKEEIASLIQETGMINYELTPVIRAGMASLDMNKIKDYILKTGLTANESNLDILDNLGIITKDRENNEYHPTAGGLLLFGNIPQQYLPHCFIKVVNKINTRFEEIKIFQGSLLDMLDNAESFIKDVIDNERYPLNAVYEAIANAIEYRDYFDVYNEISIFIFKKSIEIVSPGNLIKNNNNNLYGMNMTLRRNMWLYQRLITIDNKGRFLQTGMGFKRMRQAFSGYGRVKLVSIVEGNVFKVIFPGVDAFK